MLRFPPKRILVPFDLSETSMEAWRHAQALAKSFGAQLDAAYVEPWETAVDFIPPMTLTPGLRKEILAHMRRKIGTEARLHVIEGDPVVVLLRLAKTLKSDLIVMGTHARTGFERLWRGSVAEAMVRLSPVPVLVARGEPLAIRSVLAPVNFTDYAQYGLTYAAAVASTLGASLTALNVGPDKHDDQAFFELARLVSGLPAKLRDGDRIKLQAEPGKPNEEILRISARHGLVVLVVHKKSLLEDLVLGTTAERVLRHSPVPVLAVPAPKKPIPLKGWALSLPQIVVTK